MLLHLGAGKRRAKGMINIDIQQYGGAIDIICDITNDLPFPENSIDLIYSCGVLEHFSRQTWKNVLHYWYRLLKPGGVMQISTVDFDAICSRYEKEKNIEELVGLLLGGSKDNSYMDRHGIMFNLKYLREEMEKIGYKHTGRIHWKEMAPYKLDPDFDDFSRSYLPHLDFTNGQLMVLNVEAVKPNGAK